jgi:hypothetical protein
MNPTNEVERRTGTVIDSAARSLVFLSLEKLLPSKNYKAKYSCILVVIIIVTTTSQGPEIH